MMDAPRIFCDLEGVLMPEMWPHLASIFKIGELELTTRDIPDYRALMQRRIALLRAHRIGLAAVCDAVAGLDMLPGADEFLAELRQITEVVIVSDSFRPMNSAMLAKLGVADVLCHTFEADTDGFVRDCIYWNDLAGKHLCLQRFPTMNGSFAIGDAFNDLSMIRAATAGSLFNPSEKTIDAAPDVTVSYTYDELLAHFHTLFSHSVANRTRALRHRTAAKS